MLNLENAIIRRQGMDNVIIKETSTMLAEISTALSAGDDVFGYTLGYLSLIDLVERVAIDAGGQCDLFACIWSANRVDMHRLHGIQMSGLLAGIKLVVDPSAYTRRQSAVEAMYQCFGIDAIRSMNAHAKFVILRGKSKTLSVISSMNFTRNPRIEQFQVLHSTQISDHSIQFIEQIFNKYSPDENFTTQAKTIFNKIKRTLIDTDPKLENIDFSLT